MAKPKKKKPAAKATSKKPAKSSAKKTAKPKAKAKAKPAPKAKAKPKAKAAPKAKAKTKAAPKAKPALPLLDMDQLEAISRGAAAEGAPRAKRGAKPKAAASGEVLRGVALVDAVMEQRLERGDKLVPMAADAIDSLGFELSPALRRWLEHDGEMFTLGEPQSFAEMLDAEVGEWAEAFVDLGRYLTGQVVVFEGWGADSRRFIHLGTRDELGEYTVFTIDTDDTPFACVNGPVDVWLAQQAGYLADEEYYGFVPPEYEPVRQAHAALSFGGFIAHVDGQFSKSLDPYSEEADEDEGTPLPSPVPQLAEDEDDDEDDDDIVDRLAGITEEEDDEVAPTPPGPADEEDDDEDLAPARNELADEDEDEVDEDEDEDEDEVDEDEEEEDDIVEVDAALLSRRPIDGDTDADEDTDDDGLHEVDDDVEGTANGDVDDRGDEAEEAEDLDEEDDDEGEDDDEEEDDEDEDDDEV